MLKIVASNQFRKDLKLAKKNEGFDINHLTEVVNVLAAQHPLDKMYRDHRPVIQFGQADQVSRGK